MCCRPSAHQASARISNTPHSARYRYHIVESAPYEATLEVTERTQSGRVEKPRFKRIPAPLLVLGNMLQDGKTCACMLRCGDAVSTLSEPSCVHSASTITYQCPSELNRHQTEAKTALTLSYNPESIGAVGLNAFDVKNNWCWHGAAAH